MNKHSSQLKCLIRVPFFISYMTLSYFGTYQSPKYRHSLNIIISGLGPLISQTFPSSAGNSIIEKFKNSLYLNLLLQKLIKPFLYLKHTHRTTISTDSY